MKVKKVKAQDERAILIGMLVNDFVLSRIAPQWGIEGLFRNNWANLIGSLSIKFFNKYSQAPRLSFPSYFEKWRDYKQRDPVAVEMMESFLADLQDDYDEYEKDLNPEYILDVATRHFNKVKLEKKLEEVQDALDTEDTEAALNEIESYRKLDFSSAAGVDVFRDSDAMREAFEESIDPLIKYPGALGKFFGSELARDSLVGILAPEKRGKSFWVADIAWMGARQQRKVAFFAIGDMSRNQMLRRFGIRAAAWPKHKGLIKFPISIEHEGRFNDPAEVEFEERYFKRGIAWQDAKKAYDKIVKRTKINDTLFQLKVYPSHQASVRTIRNDLKKWERDEGWIPDVIAIDYADLLDVSIYGYNDIRKAIDRSWADLRGLSQETHSLVVTPTQAASTGYADKLLDMGDFSESKGKNAHVTAMFGINQSAKEKSLQYSKLNWIVRREEDFDTRRCVFVAECRALGRIAVKSVL